MANEIELKLYFPPEALDQIFADPALKVGLTKAKSKVLDNTYFDTPELCLNRSKVAVRVRRIGSTILQTVKCAGESVAGLSSRPEWEKPFNDTFDFNDVDDLALKAFLETERARLIPLFSTRFERHTVPIQPRPGVSILVMIDQGAVSTAQGSLPISELELELVTGTEFDLLDFAIELAGRLPLYPFDLSKAERGYSLYHRSPIKPLKSAKSTISVAITIGEAFNRLAVQAIQGWQSNLFGSLTQENPEYLHQMRVALRRLTTLLKLFKPALDQDFYDNWRFRLKDITARSGVARDLDVMKELVLIPILADLPAQKHTPVLRALAFCAQKREVATNTLDELNCGVAILELSRAIRLLSQKNFSSDLESFAEQRLGRLHETALKRLKQVTRTTTPRNAHRLRIAFKNLRYGCDFFLPLFDEQGMADYSKVVAGLQDNLGYLNDLHVALTYLEIWAKEEPKLSKARDQVGSWHGPKAEKSLRDVLRAAESILGQCQPWCGACDSHPALRLGKRRLTMKVS